MHEVDRRRLLKTGVVLLLLAAAAVGLWLGLRPVDTPEPTGNSDTEAATASGDSAPSFRLPLLDGDGRMASEDLAGSPYVLNFWATWCEPCRTEMPAFEKTWQRYRDRGVVVIGVLFNDDPEEARDFASELGVTYPLVVDDNDELAIELGVRGLPQTFFVDSDGYILEPGATLGIITEEELTKTIESMLEG
jgi:cytochrome c biogenesis protein CcmG/thiol:disulfide interchange protein DsbE